MSGTKLSVISCSTSDPVSILATSCGLVSTTLVGTRESTNFWAKDPSLALSLPSWGVAKKRIPYVDTKMERRWAVLCPVRLAEYTRAWEGEGIVSSELVRDLQWLMGRHALFTIMPPRE